MVCKIVAHSLDENDNIAFPQCTKYCKELQDLINNNRLAIMYSSRQLLLLKL